MKNLIKVFFNKSFFPFYISQFLGTFNDNFFRTALATFVRLGSIPFAENTRILITSLLITIFMLPYFLFSATSGEISDKYRKDVDVFEINSWVESLDSTKKLIRSLPGAKIIAVEK